MDLSMNLTAIVSQRLLPKKGQKGRIPSLEIMINTPLIADLILRGEMNKIHDVIERSNEIGMITMDQSLFKLYRSGYITYEDALRNADSVNNLRLKIKLDTGEGARDRLGSTLDGTTF